MTERIDLKALKEAAEKATPGPWKASARYIGTPNHMSYIGEAKGRNGVWDNDPHAVANAAHIAAANPQTVAALVAVVEAALTIDAAFKSAGTQGVTVDWGPVLETLKPFTVTE